MTAYNSGNDDLDNAVIALIARAARKKRPVTLDLQLQTDLGFDSLAITALVFQFEELLRVDLSEIDLGQIGQLRTVKDALLASRKIIELTRGAG